MKNTLYITTSLFTLALLDGELFITFPYPLIELSLAIEEFSFNATRGYNLGYASYELLDVKLPSILNHKYNDIFIPLLDLRDILEGIGSRPYLPLNYLYLSMYKITNLSVLFPCLVIIANYLINASYNSYKWLLKSFNSLNYKRNNYKLKFLQCLKKSKSFLYKHKHKMNYNIQNNYLNCVPQHLRNFSVFSSNVDNVSERRQLANNRNNLRRQLETNSVSISRRVNRLLRLMEIHNLIVYYHNEQFSVILPNDITPELSSNIIFDFNEITSEIVTTRARAQTLLENYHRMVNELVRLGETRVFRAPPTTQGDNA